jgi:hypothetical protein
MPNGNLSIDHLVDRGLSDSMLKNLQLEPDDIQTRVVNRRRADDEGTADGGAQPDVTSFGGPLKKDGMINAIHKASTKLHFDPRSAGLREALSAARSPGDVAELMIETKYRNLNGDKGPLGKPTGGVQRLKDKEGYQRPYANGAIIWHPRHGAHGLWGSIYQDYKKASRLRSRLGYPVEDQKQGRAPNENGEVAVFEHGGIFHTDESGTHLVTGSIWQKYRALNAESSILGYPVSEGALLPGRRGYAQRFQSGVICASARTGACEIHGLIEDLWQRMGGAENGPGLPIADERIPGRQAGYSIPDRKKKPVRLPDGVTKLPVEAINLDYPHAAVNIPARRADVAAPAIPGATATTARPRSITRLSADSATLRRSGFDLSRRAARTGPGAGAEVATGTRVVDAGTVEINENLLSRIGHRLPTDRLVDVISQNVERSPNRYSDFEDGVLFWQRGAEEAEVLEPLARAPDGTRLDLSGEAIAKRILSTEIGVALHHIKRDISNVQLHFAGTTDYRFDGTGVHNRNHRLQAMLTGYRRGPLGMRIPEQSSAHLEIELFHDPVSQTVNACLTNWSSGADRDRAHGHLDPLLWKPLELMNLARLFQSDHAVLSVKTAANGTLQIYVEPDS